MKILLQRVDEASVTIGGERVSAIGPGLLVFFGATCSDTAATAAKLAERTVKLRIFEDGEGKTNRSVVDTGGSILVVSQFTLYADTAHGNRPGFSAAARPEIAEPLYLGYVRRLRELLGEARVATGRFGAEMSVALVNHGPFTIMVEATEQG